MIVRRLLAASALAVLLGAASPAETGVDATLKRAYAGYFRASGQNGGDWDQPVFSAETTKLIRAWKRHNGEELTGLNDYGWLCECQDWEWKRFGFTRTALRQISPAKVEVKVRVNLGGNNRVDQRMILVLEGKRWLIDDLFSKTEPGGVKAAMRKELRGKPGE
ncbi:MAG: DUF3828 domain-containing protein [Novosphingobium sp.]